MMGPNNDIELPTQNVSADPTLTAGDPSVEGVKKETAILDQHERRSVNIRLLFLVFFLIAMVALGVGLGVGLQRDGGKTSSAMQFEPNTLVAVIGTYPGNDGDIQPMGEVFVRFNQDNSNHVVVLSGVNGLEPGCTRCGVHIHVGMSCDDPSIPGPHYWNMDIFDDEDPWNVDGFYDADDNGVSNSAFVIDSGFGFDDNVGRTVVLHAQDSSRVGCGVLGPSVKRGTTKSLRAEIGVYPGYTGDLNMVQGMVFVEFFWDGSFRFSLALSNLEANCDKCGIHIHSGTTCSDASMVGGHYWVSSNDQPDPWVPERGAYYTSDENGNAEQSFFLYSGFGFDENVGHSVVIHQGDGGRVACGVLQVS